MSEYSAVQRPMRQYAAQIGWVYLTPAEALRLRDGDEGLYLTDVLRQQLLSLNPGIVNTPLVAEIVRELNLLPPTIAGNRDALAWLRGERSIFVPTEKRERNIHLIDFEHTEANVFHVTEEWRQRGTVYRNRADVVFLVNGIPVAVAETKAAGKPSGIAEGVDQIRRYERETPELFTSAQVFEVTHLVDFYYGATWNANRRGLFNWKEVVSGDYERQVKGFFDRRRFLRLLRDYIVFLTRDDEISKIVLRQHQVRAVEKVLERVHDGDKRRALIWHTQGSGKTYTMITIAARLLAAQGREKPLVLMIVDRTELEGQLSGYIASYGIGTVKIAESKAELRDLLASDYRGLVVSMIHKFDDIRADINTRKNIIVLVDEAHRTTSGDLGNYLMGALPNATYIGFTGTPIDKLINGKGTFKVFGGNDPQGYLDKYSIAESIEDGTTVRLNYALAPSDLRVDRDTLEREFLGLAEAEGIRDLAELNAILDRAVALKEIMKTPKRVERIAAYVAQDFRERVEPMGFKTFLVAVDREACVLYKDALDKVLPPDWTEVVYSPAHNDPAALKRYHLDADAEKTVRKDFRQKAKLPKMLIVTEKLLTGFDAPILYCMYLDKPMRDHVLLQAIARVNRPYEDEDGLTKPCGFVVDFVGIFERLERALSFDSDVVGSVIQNIDALKALFVNQMAADAQLYLPLTRGWDDKAKERAIAYFEEKARREEFYTFFKRLEVLYDILSPDAALRPYVEDYQSLAELFSFIRNAHSASPDADKAVTAKTRELLRQHAASDRLELPGAIHELGVRELAALKQSNLSDAAKILNLSKALGGRVAGEIGERPFLLSIGERAKALVEQYEDRHQTTQQVLDAFEKLSEEYVDAEAQRRALDLDENTFAIYMTLRPLVDDGTLTPAQVTGLNTTFDQYRDYRWNEQQMKDLRKNLYKALRPMVGPAKMIEATNSLLRLQRV